MSYIDRRDKKGRVLRNGESQSKDGRYRFTFVENGKQKCFYSWRLERTDPAPKGKRDCEALRDLVADYQKRQELGLSYDASRITVYDLVDKYTRQKRGVRESTRKGYNTVLNYLKTDPFSDKQIDKVKISDAKMWLISLQSEKRKSYSSIHSIRGVVRPAFKIAVEDDLLVKNPFDFELSSVLINDSVTREAISQRDERRFLEFIKNDKYYSRYYEGMFILFKTGIRISEFCGLTMDDIDLNRRVMTVKRQLIGSSGKKNMIEEPKTESGIRALPITQEVCGCFKAIIERRNKPKVEPVVDGVSGFLYLDKNEKPSVANHWEKHFQYAVARYNKIYKQELPKITPHVCRHTYCTNMAKTGISPKTLQYLMGHADIEITLNVYTHIKFDDALEDLKKSGLI